MSEHERIWLEPAGAPDRCWCHENVWGDEAIEYVRLSALDEEREQLRLAAASIREWMPETLPADENGQIHFARALAESAAEAIEKFLGAPQSAPVSDEALSELRKRTFAVQHNPNCPAPWLVRLPGKGPIDMLPYGDQLRLVRHQTGDILGFGKTFEEAARAALSTASTEGAEG